MTAAPADGGELLPPELLDRIGDLEWVTRTVVRLLPGGIHEARVAGRGEEFERHRPYQQGDDLRHLDWKLLARTDRLHIRRFRERSHLQTIFVLDATLSMGFEGGAKVTKLRYGAILAAILGHLAREAGDRTGLLQVGGRSAGGTGGTNEFDGVDLPPGRSRERWHALLHALDSAEAGGSLSLAPALEAAGGRVVPGSRVVILSDFLEPDDGAALLRVTGHLRARGDEVRAIRILSPEELGLDGGNEALYLDPEDPTRVLPAAPARDPGYRARLARYYARLADEIEGQGGSWAEVSTTDPFLPLLREWFRGDGRRGVSGEVRGSGTEAGTPGRR